jgi:hypothetical protein
VVPFLIPTVVAGPVKGALIPIRGPTIRSSSAVRPSPYQLLTMSTSLRTTHPLLQWIPPLPPEMSHGSRVT